MPETPSTTTSISSTCTSPSSEDGLLTTLNESSHPHLSTLHLLIIHIGAALTLFLATTDTTIVSTSLPTISNDLKASATEYTWVGVAYLLTQTAFQPLYARISDLTGRKTILFSGILIFAIGSVLCGCAQSIKWLIAARALAGIGGGGIVSAVWVITSEIVEVRRRAIWSQALSITWSCSAIAGPLIGGFFSGSNASFTSWRWGFYINIPICAISFCVLFGSLRGVELKSKRSANSTWNSFIRRFDFIGLFLFMSASSSIIVGFGFATDFGWSKPSTLVPIIMGILVLICGGFYETYTSKDRLFPQRIFRDTTTAAILLISFFHNFAFNAGTFYLALFYQAAEGSTPAESGLKILPYSLGSSLASMPAAWFIGYWQKRTCDTSGQNIVISIGLLISTLGFGLLTLVDEKASVSLQILFSLISGVGIGMLFHPPYQVFLKTLEPHEVASGTSAFFLVRFTGATIGLAVAGTVFNAHTSLPDLTFPGSSTSIDFSKIIYLPLIRQKEVIHIISSAIRMIWTVCVPCLGFSFVMSRFLRTMPVEESPPPTPSSSKDGLV